MGPLEIVIIALMVTSVVLITAAAARWLWLSRRRH